QPFLSGGFGGLADQAHRTARSHAAHYYDPHAPRLLARLSPGARTSLHRLLPLDRRHAFGAALQHRLERQARVESGRRSVSASRFLAPLGSVISTVVEESRSAGFLAEWRDPENISSATRT